MDNPKKILMIRTDRIGDLILTTPVIEAVRKKFPDSFITVLIRPELGELLVDNPFIDEVMFDDRNGDNRGWLGFFRLVNRIKKRKYDCVINFHTKKRTNLLCFLAKIPFRLGFMSRKFGFLMNHCIEDRRHYGEKRETEYCFDLVESLGVSFNQEKYFAALTEESKEWTNKFCEQNQINESDRVIVIHAGASDPSKRWSEDRFADLVNQMLARYQIKIVLIGSQDTRGVSKKILSLAENVPVGRNDLVYDMTGLTSLSQLVGLIHLADLLISNDSGPVHIASATKTSVVSIFTRNRPGINPKRWGPIGEKAKIVAITPEQDQKAEIAFEKAGSAGRDFLELIPTEAVLEEVDALFKL